MFGFLKRKKAAMPYFYTEGQLDQYEKFIEEQCGKCEEVFHEIVSPDIHLDIIIIPPSEENPYYQLITMGMAAYEMGVPKELKPYELERAELIIRLPASWNIKSEKEEDYWPIRMLKVLGRLPINCETWLGYGHTVSKDEEDSPFADNTKLCSIALLPGLNKENQQMNLKIKGMGKINFYQLFPIYKEELAYKNEHGMEALIDLFEDNDLNPVVNINRRNYGI